MSVLSLVDTEGRRGAILLPDDSTRSMIVESGVVVELLVGVNVQEFLEEPVVGGGLPSMGLGGLLRGSL